jgi:hypothetical protein
MDGPLAGQAPLRLVAQGGGVERLARLLVSRVDRWEVVPLVIDQRRQPAGGVRIAGLKGGQPLPDVRNDKEADRYRRGCDTVTVRPRGLACRGLGSFVGL